MNVDAYLEAGFQQRELLQVGEAALEKPLGSAANGICEELTWKWIKRLSTNIQAYPKPKTRMDSFSEKISTLAKAVERHNTNDQRYGKHHAYTVTKVREYHSYRDEVLNDLRLHGGGVYFGFTCPRYDNRKHSLGVYVVPSSDSRMLNPDVRVFDANNGEYKMTFGVFRLWLSDFLVQKYGARIPENIVEMHRVGP